ncbi:MAG: C2H2-type zinc finger protein, partial [Cyclobacteriaceae bacterium]
KWGAGVFAITTFFISAFFFQAFDLNQSLVIISFRFFASFIIAFVNYIYAELFTLKWEEYKGIQKLKEELSLYINESRELKTNLQVSNQSNQQMKEQLAEANKKLESLERRERARLKYLTCTYCKEVFETEAALRGHKGRCVMNPKVIRNGNNHQ